MLTTCSKVIFLGARRGQPAADAGIEHVTAWLFRAARNRIRTCSGTGERGRFADGPALGAEAPVARGPAAVSRRTGPDAAYARGVLLEALEAAIAELPDDQRAVFVAHELEGRSFKDLAAASGVSVNTLLCGSTTPCDACGCACGRCTTSSSANEEQTHEKALATRDSPFAFLAFVALGGVVVQQLWNWLLPTLFAWPALTFWQALGLLALCRILFGGRGMRWSRGGSRSSWRGWGRRWQAMTPGSASACGSGCARWGYGTAVDESPARSCQRFRRCPWRPVAPWTRTASARW